MVKVSKFAILPTVLADMSSVKFVCHTFSNLTFQKTNDLANFHAKMDLVHPLSCSACKFNGIG